MTKFTIHDSSGKIKDIDTGKEEQTEHEAVLEFLNNMCDYFKNEYDKKIKSIAIITTHDDKNDENVNFSLAGFNLPSDDLILLMEKIKMKILLDETISY